MEKLAVNEKLQEGMFLLQGVVLGYRTNLNQCQISEDFKLCGLSHLIAVSGSHLAVVATLLAWVLERLGCKRKLCVYVTAGLLIAYVVLTGLQASAIRSCIMAIVGSFAWLFGRRRHSISALALAAFALLLCNPVMCFSLGFQLSVAAVLSLTLFAPLLQFWLSALVKPPQKPGLIKSFAYQRWLNLASLFALTFAAMMGTLPLALPRFSILSLVGPFVNVVISPLISLQIIVGIVAVVLQFLFPGLAQVLYFLGSVMGAIAAVLTHTMSSLPLSFISLSVEAAPLAGLFLGAAIGLWIVWPKPNTKRIKLLMLVAVGAGFILALCILAPARPQIIMLDVGQGDAILIRDGNHNYLVDTGNEDELLQQALTRQRVFHIDALFITHLDQDHCGSLKALGAMTKVDEVYLAFGTIALCKQDGEEKFADIYEELCNLVGEDHLKELRAGNKSSLGKHFELQVVWPKTKVSASSNEESLSFFLRYKEKKANDLSYEALFTGDGEAEVIQQILKNYPYLDNYDLMILKVPHHGSKGGIDADELRSLHPAVALISVGENNSYGHPSKDTLELLQNQGVVSFRSDIQGDVKLLLKRRCLRATCQHGLGET